jgi:hypothetical protein
VQVSGYEQGLALSLCEHIESTGDLPLALSAMAGNLANVVARGVYARYAAELDSIEEQLRAEPRWIEEVPEPEPVVTHDLEAVTVVRNGVQSEIAGSEFRQKVEDASRNAVVWSPEETGVQYETDTPWGSWAAADQSRSYRSAHAYDAIWLESITRRCWVPVVTPWNKVGYPQECWTRCSAVKPG